MMTRIMAAPKKSILFTAGQPMGMTVPSSSVRGGGGLAGRRKRTAAAAKAPKGRLIQKHRVQELGWVRPCKDLYSHSVGENSSEERTDDGGNDKDKAESSVWTYSSTLPERSHESGPILYLGDDGDDGEDGNEHPRGA